MGFTVSVDNLIAKYKEILTRRIRSRRSQNWSNLRALLLHSGSQARKCSQQFDVLDAMEHGAPAQPHTPMPSVRHCGYGTQLEALNWAFFEPGGTEYCVAQFCLEMEHEHRSKSPVW
jgi:hypothetical protein